MLRGNELINETGQDGIQRTLWRVDCPEPRMLQDSAFKASVASIGHRRRFRTFYNLQRAFTWVANALPGEPVKPAGSCATKVWTTNAHRDIILQVALEPIRRIAYRRANKLLSQTGSFTVGIEDESLSSLAKFTSAMKHAARTDETSSALRQARRSRSPKSYATSSAPSDNNQSVWGGFYPSPAEIKPSLRIEIPNDAAEDVAAHVTEDLAAQESPCGECNRLFPLKAFFGIAQRLIKTPEQRDRLQDLQRRAATGELTKACPLLFHALGIRPSSLPQKGPLAKNADEFSCRLQALAGHYSWRVSMRYVYRAARRGGFVESLRQDGDSRDIGEVAEENTPVWVKKETAQESPESILLAKITSEEYFRKLTNACRLSFRKDYAQRAERTLAYIAESQVWPTGSEVANLFGVTGRTGRNLLEDLSKVIRDVDSEVNAVAV